MSSNSSQPPSGLQNAKLSWRNASTPVADAFDDIYFSSENGLQESQYVYLEQNQLSERFQQLNSSDKNHFTVAETGFGTGLNCLLTAKLWQQHIHDESQQLFFISTEKYPLNKADLQQSLSVWHEDSNLLTLSKALLEQYPPAIHGQHIIQLAPNITLMLLLGDASESLSSLVENHHPMLMPDRQRAVDAWFLDGFAPSKNPDMWQQALFTTIAKLSHRNTTLASFTAAGIVKRGLQSVGFSVKKIKGFGKKREMITAKFKGLPIHSEPLKSSVRDFGFSAFWPIYRQQKIGNKTAIVIGAGIAGCTTAKALAEAGIQVTLIDTLSQPLLAASGNAQAVLYPKLAAQHSAFSTFNLSSFLYAQHYYRQSEFADSLNRCGVIQLINSKNKKASEKLLAAFAHAPEFLHHLDNNKASNIANTHIENEAIFYPQAGFINTQKLAKKIINHPNIQLIANCTINHIKKVSDTKQWQATSNNETFNSDMIVICCAQASKQLLPNTSLPTKDIRGQVSHISANGLDEVKTVVCDKGYIAPALKINNEQQYHCGASFDIHENSHELSPNSQQTNFTNLAASLPNFSTLTKNPKPLKGKIGFRCAAPDYMPIVGPVPINNSFSRDYALLKHNAKAHLPTLGDYQQGLFVNMAYGSRGYASAPINALLIRAYCLQQPYPFAFELIKALSPARFLINELAGKNKRPQ